MPSPMKTLTPGQLTASTEEEAAAIKLTTPTFPATPTSRIDHDSALADWNGSTPSVGVRGYFLEWRESLDTAEGGNATVTATSRTISGLDPNKDYQWRVTAKARSASYEDSDPSGWQNFKTTKRKLDTPTLPSRPTLNIDHDSAAADWNASAPTAGVGGYLVEWRESLDTAEGGSATQSATTTTLTISGLDADKAYEWRVRANARGADYSNSDFTGWQAFRTEALVAPPPTNVRAQVITSTYTLIRWNDPGINDKRRIYTCRVESTEPDGMEWSKCIDRETISPTIEFKQ